MNISGISPSQSSNSDVRSFPSNKRKSSAIETKVVGLAPESKVFRTQSINSTSSTSPPDLHSMSAQDIVNRLLHDSSLNCLSRCAYYEELKAHSDNNACDNLALTFKYETSLNHVSKIFNCCSHLHSLSIHFNYWENDDPTVSVEDIYFSSLETILNAFHNPSSLTSLEFRGYRPHNTGLGLSDLELINNFLKNHKLKLNHLYLDIHTHLWEQEFTKVLEILESLRTFTENMSISVAFYDLTIEELQQLRTLKLQGVRDGTYDHDLSTGTHSFVTEYDIIEEYFIKYLFHYKELANWESLENLDLSHLDFINHSVFREELDSNHLNKMQQQMCERSPPKELFGEDEPQLQGAYAVDKQELFDAIAKLPVKNLTWRYPHCKVHSLLKNCLEKGLKNLVELNIVGYCEAMGSSTELYQLLTSSRTGLKCTIECENSWATK